VQDVAQQYDDVPILIDDAQLVSEALGVARSGDVIVFNPSSFRVDYRGPAGDQLKAALDNVVAGTMTESVTLTSPGAEIVYAARDRNMSEGVSYSKDVAPVLARHCADCHRDGGIGPFALDSHAMAQGWSPMIREVLMTKRMPPAQIDPHVGEFSNSYNVPFEDQQKYCTGLHKAQKGW